MNANDFLLVFATSFTLCVLTTPFVTRLARWAGAIDKPDNNRKVHASATPRMGGLALAVGLFAGMIIAAYLQSRHASDESSPRWATHQLAIWLASVIVLIVGVLDDTQELRPRIKLLGQSLCVMILYFGGIRIERIAMLGAMFNLDFFAIDIPFAGDTILHFSPAGFLITWFWFIACMNIWNLIDGMDGLASGVGLLVSGTLTIIALHGAHIGPAALSVALSGGLAGFLLYNWHPACIFLGDSGSLLIGLMVGVIGVEGSLKGPSAVSILFPILAMGLPISDTAMAIFRRWVRNLPLSAADRRHIHHLLIGLGLNPRQAAVLLYCFSGFLCGVVLLGLAFNHEFLALTLGLSGCTAFLVVLMSRRDELTTLRSDLSARMSRGRQDRAAAVICFTTIQKQDLCRDPQSVWVLFESACRDLGIASLRVASPANAATAIVGYESESASVPLSWRFELPCGTQMITCTIFIDDERSILDPDIIYRYSLRMIQSSIIRIEYILAFPEQTEIAKSESQSHETSLDLPTGPIDKPAMEVI
jgi:UDP-GlcNAc:undecaprenyl-phosphate GlcNAc-1-phosphate transferase